MQLSETITGTVLSRVARGMVPQGLAFLRFFNAVLQAVCEIGFAWWLMRTVDAMVAFDVPATMHALVPFSLFMAGMAVNAGLAAWWSGVLSARFSGRLRSRVLNHYLEVAPENGLNAGGASLPTMLTKALQPLQDWFGRDRPALAMYLSKFILAVAVLAWLNPQLLVAALLLIPPFVWLSGKTGAPLGAKMKEVVQRQSGVNDLLLESEAGLPVIKAFRATSFMLQRVQNALADLLHANLAVERRKAVIQVFEILINYAPFIATFLLGGWFAVQGTLTAGGLLAFVQLVGCLAEPAAVVPVLLSRRKMAIGAAEKVDAFLRLPKETLKEKSTQPESRVFEMSNTGKTACMKMEGVQFYRGEEQVLSDISLTLQPGTVTALVGPSGSGKTTVLHLVAGLLEPVEGRVTMPSLHPDMPHVPASLRRKKVSLATQQPVLFQWSLRDNVSCANPDAGEKELQEILKITGSDAYITRMGGSPANSLSGGQAQRLGIARALMKDAPLLLLDEPTSALDREAEAGLLRCLDPVRTGKTILLASHRPETILRADHVVLLHGGSVADEGTHTDLFARNDLYRRLYEDMEQEAE